MRTYYVQECGPETLPVGELKALTQPPTDPRFSFTKIYAESRRMAVEIVREYLTWQRENAVAENAV